MAGLEQFELDFSTRSAGIRLPRGPAPPRRTAPYEAEPGYFEPGGLWLYGNSRLLDGRLGFVSAHKNAGESLRPRPSLNQ